MKNQKGDTFIKVIVLIAIVMIFALFVIAYKDQERMKANNCQPTGKEKMVNELQTIYSTDGKISYMNGVAIKYEYFCSVTNEYLWR